MTIKTTRKDRRSIGSAAEKARSYFRKHGAYSTKVSVLAARLGVTTTAIYQIRAEPEFLDKSKSFASVASSSSARKGSKREQIEKYLSKHPDARTTDVAEACDAPIPYVSKLRHSISHSPKQSAKLELVGAIEDDNPREESDSFLVSIVNGCHDPMLLASAAVARIHSEGNYAGLQKIIGDAVRLLGNNQINLRAV
jgi:hypothetical protein